MRRTRAADPKNKKGDKKERGKEGGGGREGEKEKKKRRGKGFFGLGSCTQRHFCSKALRRQEGHSAQN